MRFVLARPRHPGNVGAAARAIKVMGFDDMRIVAPEAKAYPSNEATQRSASAVDVLQAHPIAETLEDAIGDCEWVVGLSARRRNEGPGLLDVREAARLAAARAGKVAWVFGNERHGLSNEELTRCHSLVRIPTGPELSSLNLGAAVQVVAYEAMRAKLDAEGIAPLDSDNPLDGDEEVPATRGEIDAVIARLWERVETFGVFGVDRRIDAMRERLRRLVSRAAPTSPELRVVHGVVTWIDRWEKKRLEGEVSPVAEKPEPSEV